MNLKQIIFSGPSWLKHVARLGSACPGGNPSFRAETVSESNVPRVSTDRDAEVSGRTAPDRSSVHTLNTNMFRMGKSSGTLGARAAAPVEGGESPDTNPFSRSESIQKKPVNTVRVVRNDLTEEDLEVISPGGKVFLGGWLGWSMGKGRINPFSKHRD